MVLELTFRLLILFLREVRTKSDSEEVPAPEDSDRRRLTLFVVVFFDPALHLSLFFPSQLWVRYSYLFSLLLFLRSVLQVQSVYSS
jgi:hypothetical protein